MWDFISIIKEPKVKTNTRRAETSFFQFLSAFLAYYHPPNMFPYGEDAGDTVVEFSSKSGPFENSDQETVTLDDDLHIFDFTEPYLSVRYIHLSLKYCNLTFLPRSNCVQGQFRMRCKGHLKTNILSYGTLK